MLFTSLQKQESDPIIICLTIGVPGIGPFGFVGTNMPGFPNGYPLGTKWKMTDHGYVLDKGFQHPMAPHTGKYTKI